MSYLPRQYFDAVEGSTEEYEKNRPKGLEAFLHSRQKEKSPAEQTSFDKFLTERKNKQPSRQPSETRGGDEPSLASYGTIPISSLKAGVTALPRTTYDFAKFLLGATPGPQNYILQGLEKLEESAPDKFKEVISSLFPNFEQAYKEIPEYLAPEPKGAFQKFEQKAGRFAGESLPTAGATTAAKFGLGTLGAAAGEQTAEELNLNPLARAALAMTGGFLGHSAPNIRTPKQRITPQAQEYIDASRALGIDPLATGMNPSQLQKVAQKWATHGRGGPEILENAYRQRSSQVVDALEETLDQVGANLYANPVEAGESFQGGIERARNQVEHTKRDLYRAVDATVPPNERIRSRPGEGLNAEAVSDRMIEAQNVLEESIAQSPKESSAHRRLVNARDALQELNQRGGTTQLLDAQGNLIREPANYEMGVRELEAARRSLGEVIDWHMPGGADKLLVPTYREIGNILDRYGHQNPAYRDARNAANRYFQDEVLNIRTNLLDAIKDGKLPEDALSKMNKVSQIRNVRQALNNLPDGPRLFDALARFKVQQLIFDKIIDPTSGLMKLPKGAGNGLHNFLSKDRNTFNLFQELLPAQSMERLRQLEHVGQGLYKGFNALVNPSGTADTLLAMHEILSPGKQIAKGTAQILRANLGEGALNVGAGASKLLAPRMLARIITDPQFANRIYETARAGDRGNWTVFNRLLSSISEEMKEEKTEK